MPPDEGSASIRARIVQNTRVGNETIESAAMYFPVTTAQEATEAAGGYASVTGSAIVEGGCAVRVSDDLVVSAPDVDAWPEDVAGQSVVLRGRIQAKDGGFFMETSLYELADG